MGFYKTSVIVHGEFKDKTSIPGDINVFSGTVWMLIFYGLNTSEWVTLKILVQADSDSEICGVF